LTILPPGALFILFASKPADIASTSFIERSAMNYRERAICCMIGIACFFGPAAAEEFFSAKIGFAWPEALATAAPSGDAELAYGYSIDKKLSYGLAADFLWNVQTTTVPIAGSHFQVISDQQAYMFPVMFFVQLDPFSDLLIIHPAAHFDIGYNSMVFNYTGIDSAGMKTPLSPYFNGLIIKFGIDGLYDTGKHSAIYLGLEYQWANTSTSSNSQGLFDIRNMSGLGLSAGFRVEM
jgi:hypothetical protein